MNVCDNKLSCHWWREITTNAKVDYEAVARNVLKEIGYDDEAKGMDYRT